MIQFTAKKLWSSLTPQRADTILNLMALMPYHWVDPLTLFPPHLVSQGSGSGAVSPLSYAGSGWSLGWTKAHEVLAAALCGKIPSLLTQGSLCLLRLPCLVSWPVTSTPLHYHGLAKKQLLFCPVGKYCELPVWMPCELVVTCCESMWDWPGVKRGSEKI